MKSDKILVIYNNKDLRDIVSYNLISEISKANATHSNKEVLTL